MPIMIAKYVPKYSIAWKNIKNLSSSKRVDIVITHNDGILSINHIKEVIVENNIAERSIKLNNLVYKFSYYQK